MHNPKPWLAPVSGAYGNVISIYMCIYIYIYMYCLPSSLLSPSK